MAFGLTEHGLGGADLGTKFSRPIKAARQSIQVFLYAGHSLQEETPAKGEIVSKVKEPFAAFLRRS